MRNRVDSGFLHVCYAALNLNGGTDASFASVANSFYYLLFNIVIVKH